MNAEPKHFLMCETSIFHGRNEDDWFLLEWWGPAGGWVVYEAPLRSLYSDDSRIEGP